MKMHTFNILSGTGVLLSAVAVLSCSVESPDTPVPDVTDGTETMTFVAGTASENSGNTKTTIVEGNQVWWSAGDEIAVFSSFDYTAAPGRFTTRDADGGPVAEAAFTGNVVRFNEYVAVYPYDETVEIWKEDEYSPMWISMDLPFVQRAVDNDFPEKAIRLWAVTSDDERRFEFKHLTSLMKFNLTGDEASWRA